MSYSTARQNAITAQGLSSEWDATLGGAFDVGANDNYNETSGSLSNYMVPEEVSDAVNLCYGNGGSYIAGLNPKVPPPPPPTAPNLAGS
jgi:hypothetical protein